MNLWNLKWNGVAYYVQTNRYRAVGFEGVACHDTKRWLYAATLLKSWSSFWFILYHLYDYILQPLSDYPCSEKAASFRYLCVCVFRRAFGEPSTTVSCPEGIPTHPRKQLQIMMIIMIVTNICILILIFILFISSSTTAMCIRIIMSIMVIIKHTSVITGRNLGRRSVRFRSATFQSSNHPKKSQKFVSDCGITKRQ